MIGLGDGVGRSGPTGMSAWSKQAFAPPNPPVCSSTSNSSTALLSKPPAVSRSRTATWANIAALAFESEEPRPCSHPSGDLSRGRGIGPCRLIAERGGVQAGVQHEPGSGRAAGHLACQRHGCPAGPAIQRQAMRTSTPAQSRGVDPAAARDPHQPTGQLHYGVVIFAGSPQRVGDRSSDSWV